MWIVISELFVNAVARRHGAQGAFVILLVIWSLVADATTAVVHSESTGAYGVAWNQPGRDAAIRKATEDCRYRGGGNDCKPLTVSDKLGFGVVARPCFANECGISVIVGRATAEQAEADAVADCARYWGSNDCNPYDHWQEGGVSSLVSPLRTQMDVESLIARGDGVTPEEKQLIADYLEDYSRTHLVSDEQIRQEYARIKAQLGDREFKVRHILVEAETEAYDVLAKIKRGANFAELAKRSKDGGSKDNGGDLGWANRAAYVKPFSDAMVQLGKGKMSEKPVKSDFGYHIIVVDDVRKLTIPTLEESRAVIARRLQDDIVRAHIDKLRAMSKGE